MVGNNKIVAQTGRSAKPYFRPSYGDHDMWSVDSLGRAGLTASQICTRVVSSMDNASSGGNGYIILFHVGSAAQDAAALPCITSKLETRGSGFGTVAQVIAP